MAEKKYRIDGETKYLELHSGGAVSGEATDCEMIFWEELQKLRARDAAIGELVRAAEFAIRAENHSPCRSGGFGEKGVCPNVCICKWSDDLGKAISAYKKTEVQHG